MRPYLAAGFAVLGGLLLLGVMLAALFRRRWPRRTVLGLVFLAVGLGHGWVLWDRGTGGAELPEARDGAVTVFALNTLGGGASPEQVVDAALDAGADVLALPETSEDSARTVATALSERTGTGFQVFAHRTGEWDASSTALLVSEELGEYVETDAPTTAHGAVRAAPADGTGPTLLAVHPFSPHAPGRAMDRWRADVRAVTEPCRSECGDIVAGDLNATLDHEPMRDIGRSPRRAAASRASWSPGTSALRWPTSPCGTSAGASTPPSRAASAVSRPGRRTGRGWSARRATACSWTVRPTPWTPRPSAASVRATTAPSSPRSPRADRPPPPRRNRSSAAGPQWGTAGRAPDCGLARRGRRFSAQLGDQPAQGVLPEGLPLPDGLAVGQPHVLDRHARVVGDERGDVLHAGRHGPGDVRVEGAVRPLSGLSHAAGLLVAHGEALRPPAVHSVLGDEPLGDPLVGPPGRAGGVEQLVPLLPRPAGAPDHGLRTDRLVVPLRSEEHTSELQSRG